MARPQLEPSQGTQTKGSDAWNRPRGQAHIQHRRGRGLKFPPRGAATCPRSHSLSVAQSELRLKWPYEQAHSSKPPGRRKASPRAHPGHLPHVPTDTGREEQVCAHSAWGGGPAQSVCSCTAVITMTRLHLLCAKHGTECPTGLTLLKAQSFFSSRLCYYAHLLPMPPGRRG